MIHTLGQYAIYLVIISGFAALLWGDWRKLKLKFAVVLLSTVTATWFAILLAVSDYQPSCSGSDLFCSVMWLYVLARNLIFVLLNVALGRDAILIKNKERRKAVVQGVRIAA